MKKEFLKNKTHLFFKNKDMLTKNKLNDTNFNYTNLNSLKRKKNISIPKTEFNTLNNFFTPKINSTPLLNVDITDDCFDLEIQLNDLKSKVQELKKKEAESKLKSEEKNKIIEESIEKLNKSNFDLDYINCTIIDNEQKLAKLKEIQKELINKIPQDKIYHQSNKNNKLYKELKFIPHQIEDIEMFKILNKDLIDYQKYITEKIRKKIPLISNLINEIKSTVNQLTQDYDVQIYGSYANGLCMPWSDLDLVLVNKSLNINNSENNSGNIVNNENVLLEPNNEPQSDNASVANTDSTRESVNQANQNNLLMKIYTILKNKPWVKQLMFNENLSVKVLRIITREEYSEINIDISVENDKHNGLKCVNLVKSYLNEYTVLKPITIALKAILQSANLHNPNKGGLSSYGLILMVVSYIQSQKENFGLKNEPDLCGKIFYGFLKHYGILFDFNKYLILTYPINETNFANSDKESYLNINQFSQEFIILDPLNNKNNVANASFQFMNLKMAFMIAFMVTKEDCDCGCHYGRAVYENSFNSTEHSYLKRMLNSVRRFQG